MAGARHGMWELTFSETLRPFKTKPNWNIQRFSSYRTVNRHYAKFLKRQTNALECMNVILLYGDTQLHTQYCSGDKINKNELGRASSAYG
jgi:hypothetical protein